MGDLFETVPLARVIIGDRVREEYGDIERLAGSIRKWGQLFPVIVDQDYHLCDGGRRLRALEAAGEATVNVSVRILTDDERQELELEIDREHKSLTDYERSKRYLKQAYEAETRLAEREAQLGPNEKPNSRGGPKPKKEFSQREIAREAGIGRTTLQDAEAHVLAVNQFPDLAPLSQKEAIREARKERLKNDPAAKSKQIANEGKAKDKRFLAQYSRKVVSLHDVAQLDAATLAPMLDSGAWDQFDRTRDELLAWFEAMERARTKRFHLVS